MSLNVDGDKAVNKDELYVNEDETITSAPLWPYTEESVRFTRSHRWF